MTTLPDWQNDLLTCGELYRVGGSVRDELLGLQAVQDTDYLVRGLPPERLEEILGKYGKLVLVGRAFGVYKFAPRGTSEAFDIAFPRRERSLGPGHREFSVNWDWRMDVVDDLKRRDFTINAMARSVRDGLLVDPLRGQEDLDSRLLRMIFPAAFVEDPLRILRGIRFACRFGLTVERETWKTMIQSAPLMDTLSAERVQAELTGILVQCHRPSGAFGMMRETGVLARVLPEIDRCAGVSQNEYHPDDVFIHSVKTCDQVPRNNLVVRWAALLHDIGKVDRRQMVHDEKLGDRVVFYGHQAASAEAAVGVLRRLRYRNALIKKCEILVRHHMFNYNPAWKPATVRRFIRQVGEANLEDLFLLREADVRSRDPESQFDDLRELRGRVSEELAERAVLKVSDLAVDGEDVKRLCGLEPGPVVGKILGNVLEAVLEEPGLNERDRLLEWIKERYPKSRKPV